VGQLQGPDIPVIMELLGKDEVQKRVQNFLQCICKLNSAIEKLKDEKSNFMGFVERECHRICTAKTTDGG
ncbi:hypothetical protein, partial [Ornithobacterium rhinotracheale]